MNRVDYIKDENVRIDMGYIITVNMLHFGLYFLVNTHQFEITYTSIITCGGYPKLNVAEIKSQDS